MPCFHPLPKCVRSEVPTDKAAALFFFDCSVGCYTAAPEQSSDRPRSNQRAGVLSFLTQRQTNARVSVAPSFRSDSQREGTAPPQLSLPPRRPPRGVAVGSVRFIRLLVPNDKRQRDALLDGPGLSCVYCPVALCLAVCALVGRTTRRDLHPRSVLIEQKIGYSPPAVGGWRLTGGA